MSVTDGQDRTQDKPAWYSRSEIGRFTSKILESSANLGVLVGIAFAFYEIPRQSNAERMAASLQQLAVFQESHIVDARLRLQEYWLRQPVGLVSGMVGNRLVFNRLATDQIFPTDGNTNAGDLLRVLDQLDLMGACIKSSVCEGEIISRQVGRYAASLMCLYVRPIDELRDKYEMKSLGTQMMAIIGEGDPCEFQNRSHSWY